MYAEYNSTNNIGEVCNMKESNTKNTEFVCRRREPARPVKKSGRAEYPGKILVNSAVCAALAMGILCLSAVDSDFTNMITNGISRAATSELVMDEDLGRIQFVNTSLPVADGEVVSVFSESGRDVQVSGEPSAEVMAVLSGTVAAAGEDNIVIQNDNGTRSVYSGVMPSVSAGDRVRENDVIGKLAEEVLALETVGGAGFVDSLSKKELTETMQ